MAVPAIIAGAGAAVLGAISWTASLPNTFKYLIFLAGLSADTGVAAFTGFQQGAVGSVFTFLIQTIFGVPAFSITSWQLFALFLALPLVLFMLRNSLSHQ